MHIDEKKIHLDIISTKSFRSKENIDLNTKYDLNRKV